MIETGLVQQEPEENVDQWGRLVVLKLIVRLQNNQRLFFFFSPYKRSMAIARSSDHSILTAGKPPSVRTVQLSRVDGGNQAILFPSTCGWRKENCNMYGLPKTDPTDKELDPICTGMKIHLKVREAKYFFFFF